MQAAEARYQQYCALCHGADRQGHANDHAPSLKSRSLLETGFPTVLREAIGYGRAGTPMGGLYRNLADFQATATREHAHLAGLSEAVAPAPVVWVPFLRSDVHDLDGLAEVAAHVFSRAD